LVVVGTGAVNTLPEARVMLLSSQYLLLSSQYLLLSSQYQLLREGELGQWGLLVGWQRVAAQAQGV
jgi:hypothetical protein